jgi:hypothetical protein
MMAGANAQAIAMENQSAEHLMTSDDAQNMSTGGDYPTDYSAGESDASTQDTQNEWMPGFGGMVS